MNRSPIEQVEKTKQGIVAQTVQHGSIVCLDIVRFSLT